MSKNPVALAFDLGGTKLGTALIAKNGSIKYEQILHVDSTKLVHIFGEAIRGAVDAAGKKNLKIVGAGIASAGPMNLEKGILIKPPNLPGIQKFEIVKAVQKLLAKHKLKVKVHFQNDAMAAALAEGWLGRAKGCKTFVCVTVGTGLGSGVVFKGEPLQFQGQGSEWGHAMYGNVEYEDTVSGTAILKRAAEVTGTTFESLSKIPSDLLANPEFMKATYGPVSHGLAAFCKTLSLGFSPEKFVFAGGVMRSKQHFWDEFKIQYKQLMEKYPTFEAKIEECKFENSAGVVGAAYLVWRNR